MVEFHVLKCADCQTFQVLQVTKTTKWKCKMCGQKQSITKVYGQGSGADCRRHVQKLNSLRCQTTWTMEEQHLIFASEVSANDGFSSPEDAMQNQQENYKTGQVSRWSHFVDETHDDPEEDSYSLTEDGNKSDFKVATDWTEYQDYKTASKKRRPEMRDECSAITLKKIKNNSVDQTNTAASEGQPSHISDYAPFNGQLYRSNASHYLNTVPGKIFHANLVSNNVHTYDKGNLSPSLSTGLIRDEDVYLSSPLSTRLTEEGGVCSRDKFKNTLQSVTGSRSWVDNNVAQDELTDPPSYSKSSRGWMDKRVVTDVSHNFLRENKVCSAQNKLQQKGVLLCETMVASKSETMVASKWGVFLENENNIEDDDDDTYFENDYIYTTNFPS